VSAVGIPSCRNINDLNCQTILTERTDPQRVFPALSNLTHPDDDRCQTGRRADAREPLAGDSLLHHGGTEATTR
jgi:hypothetical protein